MASAGVILSLAAGRRDDLGESKKASLACGLTGLQLGGHSRDPGLSLVSLLHEIQVFPGWSL